MRTLICLGAGIEGLPIIERAKALGHKLYVVDGNPDAPGMALADWRVVASCYDPDASVYGIAQTGATHASLYPPDGVICCAIDAPHVAAAVAKKFGLPGLSTEAAHLSVDKLAQKTALRAAGLPVPEFQAIRRDDAIPAWAGVVKPTDSRGARSVRLLNNTTPEQARLYILEAEYASRCGQAMVEQYLSGPQLSTESIVQDGRVLFTAIGLRNYDRLAEFAPHVIEDGFDEPYHGRDGMFPYAVKPLLEDACRALGWKTLTVKGDWIIHDGALVILELAARLSGGFFATHGHSLAYGINFVGFAIDLALGERIGIDNRIITAVMPNRQYVCQRYVFPQPGDIGRKFSASQRRFLPHTVSAEFVSWNFHPGDVIQPVTSHASRWGQAICTGATPQKARERAERAVAAMKAAVVLE